MKQQLINILLLYFRYFARLALKNHRPLVIGITGSAGKSSARTMLHAILKDHFPTRVVAENSEIGMPLGILGLKPKSLGFETFAKSVLDWIRLACLAPSRVHNLKGIKYLVVEMGIDDPYPPKNMEYLLTIVKPDIAIYLNAFAGAVHSMQFEKIIPPNNTFTDEEKREIKAKAIAAEKAKIITQSDCKVGIYNADNLYSSRAIEQWNNRSKTKLLSFGKTHDSTISYEDYNVTLEGTDFSFAIKDHKKAISIQIKDYLLQKEYQETLAAVILAALQTGMHLSDIKKSLEKNFSLPKSRATMLQGINKSVIIDSSYNASGIAVEGMLDLLSQFKKHPPAGGKRPTVFLFGDMRELGEESKREHEKVAEKMFGIVDYLYLVGQQTREFVLPVIQTNEKVFKEIRWFSNAKHAGEYLETALPKEALVLVKGSQNTIFLEEAIKYILRDKKDVSKLCRQEDHWRKAKARIANSI